MNIKPNSIDNKIAIFNSYINSQPAHKNTASTGPKLINKLNRLSNKLATLPDEPGARSFQQKSHTLKHNNTAPKFGIDKTDNSKKPLLPVAKMMVNNIMADLPQIKGQTDAERYTLALNKYENHTNKVNAVRIDEKMPAINRITATLPSAVATTNINVPKGVIPPPPPPPLLAPATATYVRKEVQAASKQDIAQIAADQQAKVVKKNPEQNKEAKQFVAMIGGELTKALQKRPKA